VKSKIVREVREYVLSELREVREYVLSEFREE